MGKRWLRLLWKRILRFLYKLAGSLMGKRRYLRLRRHRLINETSQNNVIYDTPSHLEKTISGNKNVVQNVKGNQNIIVGIVEGSLTINYRRPIDILFQAPRLPSNFVDRPEVSLEIKARLLADKSSDASAVLISAIHGLGGIGKTVLATALAYDEDIQKRFSGGVLWATLGQKPDIQSLLSSWIQALGDYDFRAINVETTSAHLRSLLHNKAVLLVVDDAWEPDHVEPFLVAGSQSQVLITSRRADVADAVGAHLQQLDVMKPEESLALLSQSLERQLVGVEKQEALQVSKTVGYLPIALNLVAARVKRGVKWDRLETDLKAEVARLEVLEGPRRKDETTLEASFNLSLKALREYNEKAWESFIWLGVLPEDVTIAVPMAVTLWEMQSQNTADEVLELLWNDALIQSTSPIVVAGAEWKSYRIHDLLHDIARRLLITATPKGLGLSLLQAHTQLLERYQKKIQNGLLHTVPSDGYIHAYLTWHLENAHQYDELHQLLQEETDSEQNGWFTVRERLGQLAGYVHDVVQARRLAEDNFDEHPSLSISLQCRYALILSSLNSLVGNIPAQLIVALVEKQVWTPSQGLAYVRQVQNPQERAEAIGKIAPLLPEILPEALEVARKLEKPSDKAQALSNLALKFPEILPEALEVIRKLSPEFGNQFSRASILSNLAAYFPEILSEAIEAIEEVQEIAKGLQGFPSYSPFAGFRGSWLIQLVHYASEVLPEILVAANTTMLPYERTLVLRELTPKLPTILPQALEVYQDQQIQDVLFQAIALNGLASQIPTDLLPKALKAILKIQDEFQLASVIEDITLQLPGNLLPQALKAVRRFKNTSARAIALSGLACKLPEILPEALDCVHSIQEEPLRAYALKNLAPLLPELLPEALEATRKIEDRYARKQILCELAPHFPEVLPETLEAIQRIREIADQSHALTELISKLPDSTIPKALEVAGNIIFGEREWFIIIPNLPESLLSKALEIVLEMQNEDNRIQALSNLAPRLPKSLLPRALEAVRKIRDELDQIATLKEIAPCLPEALPTALQVAQKIQDEFTQVQALIQLAPQLPEVLPEALEVATGIRDEQTRARALSELTAHLSEDLLPLSLKAIQTIQDKSARSQAMLSLVSRLPEILPETLEESLGIQNESARATALQNVVPYLPENLLSQVLEKTQEIEDNFYQARILKNIALKFSEIVPQALAAIQRMPEAAVQSGDFLQLSFFASEQADALTDLATHLPKDQLSPILEVIREIQHEQTRADALLKLVSEFPEILSEALEAALGIQDEFIKARALQNIVPYLPESKLSQVLEAIRKIQHESARADALFSLVSRLPEIVPEALEAVLGIQDDSARARALQDIVPYLPEILLPKILEKARELQDESQRTKTLSKLVAQFPELLAEVLEAVSKIQSEYEQADIIKELAPQLRESFLIKALEIASEIDNKTSRAEVVRELALELKRFPSNFSLWKATLHALSTLDRKDLLKCLPNLNLFIINLGGSEALAAAVRAIQDVCKEWR